MGEPSHLSAGLRSRSRILDYIRASGQISRVELARMSGLNEATISHLVRKMIEDGLVHETGHGPSTGGKPRTLLDINSRARHAVGVSLDGARLTVVVTDLAGRMVGRLNTAGPGRQEPEQVLTRLAALVDTMLADLQVDRGSVVGIGVASPGPLQRGSLRGSQPTPQWDGYPLEEQLEQLSGLRVVLDNDATCAALGEYWTSRNGASAPVSATVYMSDGIGCGILIDGGVYHGVSSNTGELGHVSLDVAGPVCRCGGRGCLELYAAPAAVVARAVQHVELARTLELSGADQRAAFTRIAKAAVRGDQACRQLIEDAATALGSGVVALANILDLDEVFLSGPAFADAGALFARQIQQSLDRTTFMRAVHPIAVKMSHMGVDAAALGAAALVLQEALTPHSTSASVRRRDRQLQQVEAQTPR